MAFVGNKKEYMIKSFTRIISSIYSEFDLTQGTVAGLHASVWEDYLMPILNIIYDCELKNLNDIFESNFPSIDLGDESKKICFQITVQNSNRPEKIRHTSKKFLEKELYKKFDSLYVLFATRHYEPSKGTDIGVFQEGDVSFNKDCILDFHDLSLELNKLSEEKVQQVIDYFEKSWDSPSLIKEKRKLHEFKQYSASFDYFYELAQYIENTLKSGDLKQIGKLIEENFKNYVPLWHTIYIARDLDSIEFDAMADLILKIVKQHYNDYSIMLLTLELVGKFTDKNKILDVYLAVTQDCEDENIMKQISHDIEILVGTTLEKNNLLNLLTNLYSFPHPEVKEVVARNSSTILVNNFSDKEINNLLEFLLNDEDLDGEPNQYHIGMMNLSFSREQMLSSYYRGVSQLLSQVIGHRNDAVTIVEFLLGIIKEKSSENPHFYDIDITKETSYNTNIFWLSLLRGVGNGLYKNSMADKGNILSLLSKQDNSHFYSLLIQLCYHRKFTDVSIVGTLIFNDVFDPRKNNQYHILKNYLHNNPDESEKVLLYVREKEASDFEKSIWYSCIENKFLKKEEIDLGSKFEQKDLLESLYEPTLAQLASSDSEGEVEVIENIGEYIIEKKGNDDFCASVSNYISNNIESGGTVIDLLINKKIKDEHLNEILRGYIGIKWNGVKTTAFHKQLHTWAQTLDQNYPLTYKNILDALNHNNLNIDEAWLSIYEDSDMQESLLSTLDFAGKCSVTQMSYVHGMIDLNSIQGLTCILLSSLLYLHPNDDVIKDQISKQLNKDTDTKACMIKWLHRGTFSSDGREFVTTIIQLEKDAELDIIQQSIVDCVCSSHPKFITEDLLRIVLMFSGEKNAGSIGKLLAGCFLNKLDVGEVISELVNGDVGSMKVVSSFFGSIRRSNMKTLLFLDIEINNKFYQLISVIKDRFRSTDDKDVDLGGILVDTSHIFHELNAEYYPSEQFINLIEVFLDIKDSRIHSHINSHLLNIAKQGKHKLSIDWLEKQFKEFPGLYYSGLYYTGDLCSILDLVFENYSTGKVYSKAIKLFDYGLKGGMKNFYDLYWKYF